MNKYVFLISISLIFIMPACQHQIPATFKKPLELLVGEWVEAPGIGYREVWQISSGGFRGAGFMHAGNTFSQTEELYILFQDSTLIYQATVPDQNQGSTISFPLAAFSDTSLVFVNPHHDFPNVIAYYFLSDTSLNVRVESLTDSISGFDLYLKKTRNLK
jgi:hypothetical protein